MTDADELRNLLGGPCKGHERGIRQRSRYRLGGSRVVDVLGYYTGDGEQSPEVEIVPKAHGALTDANGKRLDAYRFWEEWRSRVRVYIVKLLDPKNKRPIVKIPYIIPLDLNMPKKCRS